MTEKEESNRDNNQWQLTGTTSKGERKRRHVTTTLRSLDLRCRDLFLNTLSTLGWIPHLTRCIDQSTRRLVASKHPIAKPRISHFSRRRALSTRRLVFARMLTPRCLGSQRKLNEHRRSHYLVRPRAPATFLELLLFSFILFLLLLLSFLLRLLLLCSLACPRIPSKPNLQLSSVPKYFFYSFFSTPKKTKC